jgi:hypothetical protein
MNTTHFYGAIKGIAGAALPEEGGDTALATLNLRFQGESNRLIFKNVHDEKTFLCDVHSDFAGLC